MSAFPVFQSADEDFYFCGKKNKRTNCGNMGERIRLVTGKGKLIGTVKHDARLNCCRYKLKKGAHEIGLSKLSGKEIFIDYEVTLTTAV